MLVRSRKSRRGKGVRVDHANLFLDIFGLAFLFFHALLYRWSCTHREKQSLAYRIMIILISVYVFLDLAAWALDGRDFAGARGLYTAILLLYFAVIGCIPPLWLIYCDERLRFNEQKRRRRVILYRQFLHQRRGGLCHRRPLTRGRHRRQLGRWLQTLSHWRYLDCHWWIGERFISYTKLLFSLFIFNRHLACFDHWCRDLCVHDAVQRWHTYGGFG